MQPRLDRTTTNDAATSATTRHRLARWRVLACLVVLVGGTSGCTSGQSDPPTPTASPPTSAATAGVDADPAATTAPAASGTQTTTPGPIDLEVAVAAMDPDADYVQSLCTLDLFPRQEVADPIADAIAMFVAVPTSNPIEAAELARIVDLLERARADDTRALFEAANLLRARCNRAVFR